MRKADFQARVRKIEIVNRVLKDQFTQSLQTTLGDVALTDENLCELRQFRPNEVVRVTLVPAQVSLFDHLEGFTWPREDRPEAGERERSAARGGPARSPGPRGAGGRDLGNGEEEELFADEDGPGGSAGGRDKPGAERVLQSWTFDT